MRSFPEILPPLSACPPMEHAVIIDDAGRAWLPQPDDHAARRAVPLRHGMQMAWLPFPQVGGALLSLWGGAPHKQGGEALAVAISRTGIRSLIADLQSIDEQLEDML